MAFGGLLYEPTCYVAQESLALNLDGIRNASGQGDSYTYTVGTSPAKVPMLYDSPATGVRPLHEMRGFSVALADATHVHAEPFQR